MKRGVKLLALSCNDVDSHTGCDICFLAQRRTDEQVASLTRAASPQVDPGHRGLHPQKRRLVPHHRGPRPPHCHPVSAHGHLFTETLKRACRDGKHASPTASTA